MKFRSFLFAFLLVAFGISSATFFIENSHSANKNYWTEEPPAIKKVPGLEPEQMDQLFTNLAEVMSPTVVNIYSTSKVAVGRQFGGGTMDPDDMFKFFFGNPFDMPYGQPVERESTALGSGFIINSEGYIITNSHVVRPVGKNADIVRVKFIGERVGEGLQATIVGVDPTTDVALLKLKSPGNKPLKAASLGNSDDLKVGNWVIAIGNPYGHSHTVTQGIISALGRNIPEISGDFIQTSASINPGNSGGPLFNLKGQVVGINTAIDPRAQGIGFAIPINSAKNVVRQLIEKGEVSRGWLGLTFGELTPQIAEELKVKNANGVVVAGVIEGQPAAKAGLQVYDVITEINGRQVVTSQDLTIVVSSLPIGGKANMKIIRDGRPMNVTAVIEQRPADEALAQRRFQQRGGPNGNSKNSGEVSNKTGLVLADLNDQMKRRAGVAMDTKGVFVEHVVPYSIANQAQMRPGDIITEINRKKVSSAKVAEKEIESSLKKEKRLLLRVVRNSESRIVFLDLSNRD